jgi:heme/copper-type cytochrome/quinol oxidase subunit 2
MPEDNVENRKKHIKNTMIMLAVALVGMYLGIVWGCRYILNITSVNVSINGYAMQMIVMTVMAFVIGFGLAWKKKFVVFKKTDTPPTQ